MIWYRVNPFVERRVKLSNDVLLPFVAYESKCRP